MGNSSSQREEVVKTQEENKKSLAETVQKHETEEQPIPKAESEADEECTKLQRDIERSTDDLELDALRIPAEEPADIKAEIKQENGIDAEGPADIKDEIKQENGIDAEGPADIKDEIKQENGIDAEGPADIKDEIKQENEIHADGPADIKAEIKQENEIHAGGPADIKTETKQENEIKEPGSILSSIVLSAYPDYLIMKQEETSTWKESVPPAEVKVQVPSTPSTNGIQITTSWRTPVPIAEDTVKPTMSMATPVLPAKDTVKPTTSWRTPEPAGPTPAKQPRKANAQTKNNHGRPKQWNQSKPVDTGVTKPVKELVALRPTVKCDPHRDVPTPKEKTSYQYTVLESLRCYQRPGSSIVILKRFTCDLQSYISVLKTIDPRFMHAPEIMRVVCWKLEPYILSSWCDYAAQHHKVGRPLILTMLDFLNQKVERGFKYWYPFTKDGMLESRKRRYPDSSN